jgi:hypothetical protein
MLGSSSVAAQLAASQEGLSSMKLVKSSQKKISCKIKGEGEIMQYASA